MYGKIINGTIEYAPNIIIYDNIKYTNPTPEIYMAVGYKEVILEEEPPQTEEKYYVRKYIENNSQIIISWDVMYSKQQPQNNTMFVIEYKDIVIPPSVTNIAVAGDSLSKTILFEIGRFFDGVDLSVKQVRIKYKKSDGETGYQSLESVTNGVTLNILWRIDKKALTESGELEISLEFYDSDGYVWQTKVSSFEISPEIDVESNTSPVDYQSERILLSKAPRVFSNNLSTSNIVQIIDRVIQLEEVDNFIVQQDNLSKIISFTIPRYYDGIDLSEKRIAIKFLNADKNSNYADATNISINNFTITFDWILTDEVTIMSGLVMFAVEFISEIGDDLFIWQTTISNFIVENTFIVERNTVEVDYTQQKDFLLYYDNSTVYNKIHDVEAPFEIKNRTINIPIEKEFAVSLDNYSQIITFKIDRYQEGMDLTTKIISIKFINANGESDRTNAVNVLSDENYVYFGWILSNRETYVAGKVNFAIEFLGYDEKNNLYVWQTLPSVINIEKGLEVDGSIVQPSPTWVQNWTEQSQSILKTITTMRDEVYKNTEETRINTYDVNAMTQENKLYSEQTAQNKNASEKNAISSKSWAVGGTNSREGENTNNSKYYSEQAQKEVETIYSMQLAPSLAAIDSAIILASPALSEIDGIGGNYEFYKKTRVNMWG